jgi:hypothetical protein
MLQTKATEFSELISAFEDVLAIVRNLTSDTKNANKDRLENLSTLRDYLSFKKLSSSLLRNLHLAASLRLKFELQSQQTQNKAAVKQVKAEELVFCYYLMTVVSYFIIVKLFISAQFVQFIIV